MIEQGIIHESLNDITSRLWQGSLGFCLTSLDASEALSLADLSRAAEVEISGAWSGIVLLQTTQKLAESVARVMFNLAPGVTPKEEQIIDCLRELTNITAGNLKTALPEPSLLAIPRCVAPGRVKEVTEQAFISLGFSCDGEPFQVVLRKFR